MRTESLAEMENRFSDASAPLWHNRDNTKRRSNHRKKNRDTWTCGQRSSQDGGLVSGVEYQPRMLWPSSVPQNVQGSGQRLFAAMSDPSVCGYSAMPVTYTMQPVSLPPMYSLYQPVPVPNVRTVHHNTSRPVRSERSANVCSKISNSSANGCGSAQENGLESAIHNVHQNGDYASLPPTADSGINGDELNSEHRRYSDPGLGPAKVSSHLDSDDSVESESSVITIGRTNKLALLLMEQITDLKKYNSQLFKELSESNSCFESLKAELLQYKHGASSDYQPGMLSEFIREIREANKKYEEGLVAKVTSMLQERFSQQATEIEGLKNQLSKVTSDYEESKKRISALEDELTALKLSVTNGGREIAAFEEETLALRRELQEARASRTLAENHAAKLEKLVEILRKKVNGATAVNKIRDVPAAGVCAVPADKEPANHAPLSSSSSEEQRAKNDDDEDDDDDDEEEEDEEDDVDGENSDAFGSGKDPSVANDPKISPMTDSSVNLSGPVTDL